MATELTTVAQIKSQEPIQRPQLVLQIEGVDTIYGIGEVKKYVRIGDPGLVIGDAWKIGKYNAVNDQLDVVNLDGSSNSISQQLLQDRGGTSSVSSIQISLIDKNEAITELITPGLVVDDVLGRKAYVYLGYQETAWPQDFVRIFAGVIDEISAGTSIILNIAHPEQKKRVEIFQKINTELTSPAKYRSANIQKLVYKTRRDVVGTVTVTYTSGGTAGSEFVSVAGNNITVQIQSGTSTASQVRNAVEKVPAVLALVTVEIESGFASQTQSTQASTPLNSDTTLNVVSTKGLLLPVPAEGFRTYVKIDDEVIEYTGLTDTTITGCTRGALSFQDERAEGAHHDAEASVESFYRIEGKALDIALKILMSGGPTYFASDISIKSIGQVEGEGLIDNAVWFEGINIQDAYGVTIGDKVTITGDIEPTNNVVDAPIEDVVITPFGSYIVISGTSLIPVLISTGKIAFASKWNVLPAGAGLELGGDEVDVPEFERIKDTFSSSIFSYDFYLKDSVIAKDFIDTELLYPTGAFTLPRRGKISVGYTSAPLGSADLKVLNSTNTTKPEQTKIKRSINKYFYNNVIFQFNEAVVDDRLLSGDLEVNQDSKNRIKVGNKTLVIKARGLRPSNDNAVILEILKKRFQDRYKFGAEVVSVSSFYGKTFNSDVGDVVAFGDSTLQLPDTKKGSRAFSPRLFEIGNKTLSIKTGEVRLDLVDTGYSLDDGRYGIVSPSSLVSTGSSTSEIKIKNSYETVSPRLERTKWTAYIGMKIVVHDNDWTTYGETYLKRFSASDNYLMLVDPPLAFTPSENFIVDIAQYQDQDPEAEQIAKRIFAYTNPTVSITSGTSDLIFDVDVADADKFLENAIVLVHNSDYSVVSPEVRVLSVVGTTITLKSSLGFTPAAGYEVELIGFKDGGTPYRYL